MMHPAAIAIMIFGGLLALLGIRLFAMRGAQGTNVIKWHGFEIQLTGSSLVVFVVGAALIVFPILYGDKFPNLSDPSDTFVAKQPPGPEIAPPPKPDPPRSQEDIPVDPLSPKLRRFIYESVAASFQVPINSVRETMNLEKGFRPEGSDEIVLSELIFLDLIFGIENMGECAIADKTDSIQTVGDLVAVAAEARCTPPRASYTLELTKLVAFKTHCNCDEVGVVIGHEVKKTFEVCSGDGRNLSLQGEFKHSEKVGLMVLNDCGRFDCVRDASGGMTCGRPRNPDAGHWRGEETITRDSFQRGPQTIRFSVGQGSYELNYVVR